MSKSIWDTFAEVTDFPKLEENLHIDVAIIGGGITGITTAQLLKEKGCSVCVLETRKIGKGSTADSTGNLYTTIDHGLRFIKSKYGAKEAQKVIRSRKIAMDLIERNVRSFQLDCDVCL